MDSKTLATLMIVIVCILLFPVFIGIIGGIFGVFAGILGGFFGLIGGVFGAIFGAIAAVFGTIFRLFGGIFDGHYGGDWPLNFFHGDLFAAIVLVAVIVLIAKSRRSPQQRR